MRRATLIGLGLTFVACGSDGGSEKRDAATVAPADTAIPSVDLPVSPPVDTAAAPQDVEPDWVMPATTLPWPGSSDVTHASREDALGLNVSGLFYEPASATAAAILWAVQNNPGKLYRLVWDGTAYGPSTGDGWTTGKALRYPDGNGDPDSEGVTRTDGASPEAYVAAERNNDDKKVIRLSILRYDLSGSKGLISATHEWNITKDVPGTTLNHGIEAIAWIPDTYLVQRGFVDDSRQAAYDPALYPNHGTGLFLVGVDGTGMIYGYALDHVAQTFVRVTSFSSGLPHTMDLAFDRDVGVLWGQCGNDCGNLASLIEIDSDAASPSYGHFVMRATIAPPKNLKEVNTEGFAVAPESECSGGLKRVFWSDDSDKGGFAIRKGQVACGRLY